MDMIVIHSIILILFVHWIADFIVQTDYQGKNKSKSNLVLSRHILSYSLVMFLLALIVFDIDYPKALVFTVLNGLLHFSVDYISSRCTYYFYSQENMKGFWTIIGLDQFLHVMILIYSFCALYNI